MYLHTFYPDNDQTLIKLGLNFVKQKEILISQSNLNLIVNDVMGIERHLLVELNKLNY